VTNSVGNRSLEHYTLRLKASEGHAHELARLEHRSCTKILPPREVKCNPFATDWLSVQGFPPGYSINDGPQWVYEIKLDGCRDIAVKSGNCVVLVKSSADPGPL
jgi:ATP-dependent DNA ligase